MAVVQQFQVAPVYVVECGQPQYLGKLIALALSVNQSAREVELVEADIVAMYDF